MQQNHNAYEAFRISQCVCVRGWGGTKLDKRSPTHIFAGRCYCSSSAAALTAQKEEHFECERVTHMVVAFENTHFFPLQSEHTVRLAFPPLSKARWGYLCCYLSVDPASLFALLLLLSPRVALSPSAASCLEPWSCLACFTLLASTFWLGAVKHTLNVPDLPRLHGLSLPPTTAEKCKLTLLVPTLSCHSSGHPPSRLCCRCSVSSSLAHHG